MVLVQGPLRNLRIIEELLGQESSDYGVENRG
jgi:hypothetical protein